MDTEGKVLLALTLGVLAAWFLWFMDRGDPT